MALVAPGIARYAVNGAIGPVLTATIIDVDIDTTSGSRDDHVADTADRILDGWHAEFLPLMATVWSAQSVSWVDLDTEEGSTGETSSTATNTWPSSGTAVGDAFPSSVAILVTKVASSARGKRNGRMYFPGPIESSTTAGAVNSLAAAVLTSWQTASDDFLSFINSGESGFDRQMEVVHTLLPRDVNGDVIPGGEPIFNGTDEVTQLRVESRLATQRRRLRS